MSYFRIGLDFISLISGSASYELFALGKSIFVPQFSHLYKDNTIIRHVTVLFDN